MNTDKIDTVGQKSLELQQKTPDSRDPIELQREMQRDYFDNLIKCVESFKGHDPNKDFFIVVLTTRERHMKNVIRNRFLARYSCPTPTYDQAVYRYNYKDDNLEFIWNVPDKDTAQIFKANEKIIVKNEQELSNQVRKFFSGELDLICKKFNNEIVD